MKKRKNKRPLFMLLVTLTIVLSVYFSVKVLVSYIRPYIYPQTILSAYKSSTGDYVTEKRKTYGLIGIAGNVTDLFLGGNFANQNKIVSAISGNIEADEEHTTIIDTPLPTSSSSTPLPITAELIERTIGSAEGKTKLNSKISINNETKYKLDLTSLLDGQKPFKAPDSPQVLIVHTHATESYQPTAALNFNHTSTDRTTDTAYNMVAVGDEVAKELKENGIGVIHLRNLYDYPEYNLSYARSCKDIEAALKKYPTIKIVLDLHRDSITNKEGQKFKITTAIKNEKVAQVMIVVGTDELGLKHDNWRINLKYAVNLQQNFINISSDFARPINLRTSRFNGQTAPGAVIIEVGAAGNTLGEALASCKYIAKAVSETIK